MNFLSTVIFNNTIQTWLLAVLVTVLLFGVFRVARKVLVNRACKLAAKTATDVDDFLCELLEDLRSFFLLGLAVLLSSRVLVLSTDVRGVIRVVFIILALLQGGFLASKLLMCLINKQAGREAESQSATLKTIGRFLTGLVWAIVIVMALDSIPGIEVSTLVTTMGITGIAVAFAIQNILSDLFAALSITFDQPFAVGDVIVVDDLIGTVERIGLKSTRVRSLSGEQLIFSNSDLLSSRIRNFQQMDRRRVVLKFGVTYQTPHEKLQVIPAMVEHVIAGREKITFDRAHFTGFGDSTLDFEVVYWVENSDYGFFMDMQQDIDLKLMKRFEEENIEFAYPTQTVFLEKGN
ncbi:MAG: mechanosensitive ion channel family protein [Anaerolineaceae bacterium]|nr:mechanosensitive ion channel family protein [Anaerolineaceae bacterium]